MRIAKYNPIYSGPLGVHHEDAPDTALVARAETSWSWARHEERVGRHDAAERYHQDYERCIEILTRRDR